MFYGDNSLHEAYARNHEDSVNPIKWISDNYYGYQNLSQRIGVNGWVVLRDRVLEELWNARDHAGSRDVRENGRDLRWTDEISRKAS